LEFEAHRSLFDYGLDQDFGNMVRRWAAPGVTRERKEELAKKMLHQGARLNEYRQVAMMFYSFRHGQ
jgi:hypothetical protein